jgi:hypothetical protein
MHCLLIAVLPVPALLLFLNAKASFISYYVQFPLRIFTNVFSFGFLVLIPGIYISNKMLTPVIILFSLFECARLAFTIWQHKKQIGFKFLNFPKNLS